MQMVDTVGGMRGPELPAALLRWGSLRPSRLRQCITLPSALLDFPSVFNLLGPRSLWMVFFVVEQFDRTGKLFFFKTNFSFNSFQL
jgi:hypothetical protein